MMTRKDYIKIADAIATQLSPQAHVTIANVLEEINPRFDRDKFLKRTLKLWEEKYHAEIDDEIPY